MKLNKESKASVLYLGATLFNKGIMFITVPIFTRILSTSDYGIVTTFTSWVDILTVILSLALYMAIRIAAIDFKDRMNEFLNTIFSFTICLSIGLCALVFIYGKVLEINIFMAILAILQGAASAILMDYNQYLMMNMQYVKRAIYMALPNCISVILSIVAISNINNEEVYLLRIIPTVLVYILFEGIILIKQFFYKKPTLNKEYLKYGLAISLPLVFHGIALNILSQSDRTMITLLADSNQTGIYSLVYNFGMIATVITTSLEGIWIPWFMNKLKERKIDEINKKTIEYVKLMTYAMLCIILAGPEVLKLLSAKEYWEGISIIPPIVLSNYLIFIYTLYVNVEHFYKKTISITINTVIAAIFNIIINFVFIPYFGYVAAAYTTLASYFLAMMLHVKCVSKIEKKIYPLKIFRKPIILILVISIIYYLVIDRWLLRWGILTFILLIKLLKERKVILSYIK